MKSISSRFTKELTLLPGEFHFGSEYGLLKTLLGSCVAITMWHPQHRIGGMCHFLVASRGARKLPPLDGRYGDEAVEMFFQEVRQAGTLASEYEIKLFGGASALPEKRDKVLCQSVPYRNIKIAKDLLSRHNLTICAEDLGGKAARSIIFDMKSGKVYVKKSYGIQYDGSDK